MSSSDHYCDIRPANIQTPEDENSTYNMFVIEFTATFIHQQLDAIEGEELQLDDLEEYATVESWEVEVQQDKLIQADESSSRRIIRNMFLEGNTEWEVPEFMIERTLNSARSMVTNSCYAARKVLRMLVSLSVVIEDSPTFDDDTELSFVPANKLSIEALGTVRVEDGTTKRCAICLEDLLVGSEATRMPCSHLYHGSCIFSWLEKSKFCPLCRFEIV